MDNDAAMIKKGGLAMIDLVVKYRGRPAAERMQLKPSVEEAVADYNSYKLKLLKEGIITTPDDLAEMDDIKAEIDQAAEMQGLFGAIARFIAFVALRV